MSKLRIEVGLITLIIVILALSILLLRRRRINPDFEGGIYPKIISNEFYKEYEDGDKSKVYAILFSSEGREHFFPCSSDDISDELLNSADHEPIIADDFTESMKLIYVRNTNMGFLTVVSSAHLKHYNLSLPKLRKIAQKNIDRYAVSKETKAVNLMDNSCFILQATGYFESSLILSNKLIKQMSSTFSGDIKAYIPAAHMCFVADGSNLSAVKRAEEFTSSSYDELQNKIFERSLVYINGKWKETD